ncbi:MAG: hypothetical protein IKX14_07520, partial [Neisseriaceae bacterium]|nr:hypothetical protein [Neisseriaceae bacterium]
WVKEQARATLSDRGWDLETARHNFLHSSIANNEWETAFNQLKTAADDYKQWRNQVCAFFNFRQPEITLQQGEWTQVAQFVGYKQEWEQLDNARLLIAEFTPQQALEFHGLYNQYMQYQVLADKNMEQGIDTTVIDNQIAAIEQSLNEKVAQNLPQIENRQVMFDLFGTQLGLFDEETQEQGVSASEKAAERLPENTAQGTGTPENSEDLITQYAQSFVGKKWNSQNIQDAVILPDGAIQLQIGGAWYHENALSYSKFERINDIAKQPEYSDLDILKLKAFARSYKGNAGNIHSDFGKAESAYNIAHTTRKKIGMRGFDENGWSVYNRVTAALAMAGVNSPVYDINFDTNKIKFDPKTIANSFLGKLKEQEQSISASENSVETQPENLSGSLNDNATIVRYDNNTEECLQSFLNADDGSLNGYQQQHRQIVAWAVENGFSLVKDEKLSAFHFERNQSTLFVGNSHNHLRVVVGYRNENGEVLQTKSWSSSQIGKPDIPPELKNEPKFNTGNEHQDWENWANSNEFVIARFELRN